MAKTRLMEVPNPVNMKVLKIKSCFCYDANVKIFDIVIFLFPVFLCTSYLMVASTGNLIRNLTIKILVYVWRLDGIDTRSIWNCVFEKSSILYIWQASVPLPSHSHFFITTSEAQQLLRYKRVAFSFSLFNVWENFLRRKSRDGVMVVFLTGRF